MKDLLVSIIIPNYNSEKYISACIDSVLNQTYKDIEIIIIDDGSTDGSAEIIRMYAERHSNIRAFFQPNMNAAVARNKGLEHANGDFCLFLDSDDVLYDEAIEKLVNKIEEDGFDLVIGNMEEIDADGNVIEHDYFEIESDKKNNPVKYASLLPNPSNKLFTTSVIKKNNISFGNVRIGQDLNFYLKYLACCNKVSFIKYPIYGWRILGNSMTRSVNYRIFDITESFADVRKFYKRIGKEDLYDEYILSVEFQHYHRQMDKQYLFETLVERRLVVDYFSYYLKRLDISKCRNFSKSSHEYCACRLKLMFKYIYCSRLYSKWKNKNA